MKVLVLGAEGLLGSNMVAEAIHHNTSVTGTYHSQRPSLDIPLTQLDIRDQRAVNHVLDAHTPTVVVNCAAMTDVDDCEEHPELAHDVNAQAPGRVATACRNREITFVHISTDYVFDGTADTPYDESASPAPIQVYGDSKLQGERIVRDVDDAALIVRLSFIWGLNRATNTLSGFPAWVQDSLTAGDTIPLFTDQYLTPSRAGAAAKTILELVAAGQDGLFHIASRSCITPYEFGLHLCEYVGLDISLLNEGRLADIDRPAARPRYSCLDVSKVQRVLSYSQPTLEADLTAVAPLF